MPDQSYQGKLSMFPYDPRFNAIAPPAAGIFDEPTMSICFNVEWAAHIDGVLSRLLWTDAWAGEPATQQWAVLQVTQLLVSMIARTPCGGGMDCCDDILDRLDAIQAAIAQLNISVEKLTPREIQDQADQIAGAYDQYIDDIEAVYEGDITNVHPDMAYGDSNDPIRDQALCFICQRFVDICCDWVVQNIQWKQANQQTALNVASAIASVSDVLGRIFAETSFGAMFSNIDTVLSLEIEALTLWVTTVSVSELAIFQDTNARKAVACAWYEELKGETPTLSRFLSSLYAAPLTGNADTIRLKLGGALTPVDEVQQPNGEHLYFIWADLWQEAYNGAQAGIIPDCICDEPPPADTPNFDVQDAFPILGYYWLGGGTRPPVFVGNPSPGFDTWDIPFERTIDDNYQSSVVIDPVCQVTSVTVVNGTSGINFYQPSPTWTTGTNHAQLACVKFVSGAGHEDVIRVVIGPA